MLIIKDLRLNEKGFYLSQNEGIRKLQKKSNKGYTSSFSGLCMQNVDIVIIGGGIIGLASALSILRTKQTLKIAILEKETSIAQHQTGRNSGVMHSGIYYRPGSLKAENCRRGTILMRTFCQEKKISFQQCGKVIVATHKDELARLTELEERGRANGVEGLERIGPERLREIEPHVFGIAALYSPKTSIVDFKEVAAAYAEEIKYLGGDIYCSQQVERLIPQKQGYVVCTKTLEFQAAYVVNCAGLHADRIAHAADRNILRKQIVPFRGEYYELVPEKRSLVCGLVYPVPDPRFPFLGVHLSRTMDGRVEAGPNAVLALCREGYSKKDFNIRDCYDYLAYRGFWKMAFKHWKTGFYEIARSYSKKRFLKDLQRLMPSLQADDLIPGGSGVRAQVVTAEGRIFDDFSIVTGERAIHILSAPSPAATSSLAIGETISKQVLKHFL